MLVCHCRVVNDRRIRDEIARGARDEFDIAGACGAGTVCGGCVPTIGEILEEHGCAPRCPVATALRPAGSEALAAPAVANGAGSSTGTAAEAVSSVMAAGSSWGLDGGAT